MAQNIIGAKYINITPISAGTYTLTQYDANALVEFSNAVTVTVPTDAVLNFPIGTTIDLLQTGTGQVTITSSATVNTPDGLKLRTRWSAATLIKRGANLWVLLGDTTV
jgi:hypothetical protein